MEKSWIIAVITIGAFVSVNSLQCYSCVNCVASALKDSDLVTCGAPVNPGPNGTEPATNGTDTGTGGANPGTNGTDPGTNGTDTETGGTNPGTNGTDTETGGTNPGNNGTETEAGGTNPGPNGTDTEAGSTNPGPNEIDTGTGGTNPGANWAKPGAGGTNPRTKYQVHRVRRNVHPETELNRGCICYGIECACDNEAAVWKASHYVDVTYVCAKGTIKGPNGTDIVIRGCAESTACSEMTQVNATDCKTCTKDKCNGAYKMQHPMVALMIVLTSLFVTK